MKKTRLISASAMLLATLLFTGCGAQRDNTKVIDKQPHQKNNRAVKDWTWEVDSSINKTDNSAKINTFYYDNIPSKIEHYQVFIDSIPNKGFNGSDGWEVYGADYLIEDTSLYQSQSNTQWKWKYLGEVNKVDNHAKGADRAISYSGKALTSAIHGEKVSLYIESYDKNWVGEYYTIPLPDVKVTGENDNNKNPDDAGKALTRDTLKSLIIAYGKNPTGENKMAIENANTSQITDMSGMFNIRRDCGDECVGFDGDISGWDTSNVTNMKFMFLQSDITKLPESFDTSNVTDMGGMFASSKLKRLPDSFDTSNVTNMEGMFSVYNYYTDQWTAADYNDGYGGGSVKEEDLPPKSTYADTCQIEYLPEGFDTSNVTNMKWMFYKNRKITSLPNSFDTSSVTNMVSMFQESVINALPMFDTLKVDTMINMFRDTKSFNKDISGWNVSGQKAIYTYDGSFIPWKDFNKDSSLQKEHIPEKFRDDN